MKTFGYYCNLCDKVYFSEISNGYWHVCGTPETIAEPEATDAFAAPVRRSELLIEQAVVLFAGAPSDVTPHIEKEVRRRGIEVMAQRSKRAESKYA